MYTVVLYVQVYWSSSTSTCFWCWATREIKRSVSGKDDWTKGEDDSWATSGEPKRTPNISGRVLRTRVLIERRSTAVRDDSTGLAIVFRTEFPSFQKQAIAD